MKLVDVDEAFLQQSPLQRLRSMRFAFIVLSVVAVIAMGIVAYHLYQESQRRRMHEHRMLEYLCQEITSDIDKQLVLRLQAEQLPAFEAKVIFLADILKRKQAGEEIKIPTLEEYLNERFRKGREDVPAASDAAVTLPTLQLNLRAITLPTTQLQPHLLANAEPVSIGHYVRLGIVCFVVLILAGGYCVAWRAVLVSKQPETVKFATDAVKTISAFFIGLATGFAGV
jgi:hypothetical protein